MSTIKVNAIQGVDGVERYLARAWVNFNGTGTVAIRASGNVSSITDNGTGDYTVNFTNALADANYATVLAVEVSPGNSVVYCLNAASAQNASARRVVTQNGSTPTDYALVSFAVFR